MFAYTVRRVLIAIVLVFVMSIVVFGLFIASPTDPARLTCGKNCTPTLIAQNRHALGYDKPITTQYVDFLKGLVHERNFPDDKKLERTNPNLITRCPAPCLGYSRLQNSLVNDLLGRRLPVTIGLSLYAFVLWIVFGVGGGIIAALCRGRWPDRVIVTLGLVGYSFPAFFIGLTLYSYLAINHKILPDPAYISIASDPVGFFRGMLLPAISLSLLFIGAYIRLTRAYMLEAMGEDYLRTARAKGLSGRRIVFKHTLRAALTPVTTIAGLDLGVLLAGAAITETVFNLNGIGKLVVDSSRTSDLPVNVAVVIVAAAFVIFLNLVVDLLYGLIDPRVRYS